MKIWIDGYEANVSQRLGSSQVAYELIKHFEKLDKVNDYTIILPDPPLEDMPKQREGFRYKILKPKRLWTKIALPLLLFTSKIKPDIFFSPTHYIPRFSPVINVVTIFDLSFLHFPESFTQTDLWQLKMGTKYSVDNADHIITISNFSKKDISENYKVDKNNITVAYPGYDKSIFYKRSKEDSVEILKKYNIECPYIIYIGTIQPRKNLIRLMEAAARIEGLNMIIVGKSSGEGKQGWKYQETLDTPKRLGIEQRVRFLGFVPSEDMPHLISCSESLIQPSLWEGFGIPVVEAMACGVSVLVSNVSSLPEVAGKAGLIFDPYSIDQIEQALRVIISDKKLRLKYSKLGITQAKKFSYDKMARVILKSFNTLRPLS